MLLIGIIVNYIFKFVLNKFCVLFAKHRRMRIIGMWAYDKDPLRKIIKAAQKLFLETYFELSMCQILAFIGLV